MRENRVRALDGIRGIAACIIAFVWHYQHFGPWSADSPFYRLMPMSFDYGYQMVELFIMLSGFGMAMGYKDRLLSRQMDFVPYFRRRVLKLYPLHFITLLVVAVLEYIFLRRTGSTFVYPNYDLYHFCLNLLCMQNGFFTTEWSFNSPSWCLSILMIQYVVFYYVVRSSRDDLQVMVKYAVLGILGIATYASGVQYPLLNGQTARGFADFSIGVLLYYFYASRQGKRNWGIGAFCFLACVAQHLLVRFRGPSVTGEFILAFILGFSPCLILCVLLFPPMNKLLSLKPLVWMGRISMPVYLLHFPVQCVIRLLDEFMSLNLDYYSRRVWLAYVVSALAVAALYDRFLSKPVARLFDSALPAAR